MPATGKSHFCEIVWLVAFSPGPSKYKIEKERRNPFHKTKPKAISKMDISNNSSSCVNEDANESLLVPWTYRSEWERACDYFNSENYEELAVELSVWKERVMSLPVGVEATLLLVKAELENRAFKNLSKNTSEVNVRSMYSLAVIRFINHVTHLAIKDSGDASSVSMFKLMSQVDIPEWIVNLRHEASHGTTLPSMETLLMAAQFSKEWLKNNYWVSDEADLSIGIENGNVAPKFFVKKPSMENTEERDNYANSTCSTLLSAFVACRVHRLRGNDIITDIEILQLLEQPYPTNTKTATLLLKAKLFSLLKTEPFAFCASAADMMLPDREFCREITTLFNIEDYFDQLVIIWTPVIEMLNKRGKLVSICVHLANIHSMDDVSDHIQSLSALWLDNILKKVEQSGRKVSQKLLPVLRTVMKVPNSHTVFFLERLLKFVEPRIGNHKVNQLKTLAAIWMPNDFKRKQKKTFGKMSSKYFTLESLSATESNQDLFCESYDVLGNWQLDPRGGINFWRRQPCGVLLKSSK